MRTGEACGQEAEEEAKNLMKSQSPWGSRSGWHSCGYPWKPDAPITIPVTANAYYTRVLHAQGREYDVRNHRVWRDSSPAANKQSEVETKTESLLISLNSARMRTALWKGSLAQMGKARQKS